MDSGPSHVTCVQRVSATSRVLQHTARFTLRRKCLSANNVARPLNAPQPSARIWWSTQTPGPSNASTVESDFIKRATWRSTLTSTLVSPVQTSLAPCRLKWEKKTAVLDRDPIFFNEVPEYIPLLLLHLATQHLCFPVHNPLFPFAFYAFVRIIVCDKWSPVNFTSYAVINCTLQHIWKCLSVSAVL